ncbi:MAG: glycogen/starch synthase [Bacteroidota bacterium]
MSKIQVLHVSAECYPAAKAGGLGDVVGALPKYLNQEGVHTAVIIPRYDRKWFHDKTFQTDYQGTVQLSEEYIPFSIERVIDANLGFPLYVANIPGKFDREGVYLDPVSGYGYQDELQRYLSFQVAVLQWVNQFADKPDVIHCHDHHTGLIPFFMKHGMAFRSLSNIPSVFTIHNGQYHGAFGWNMAHLLPWFDGEARGTLDWNNSINPLATGIKASWKLTTVSPSYMEELRQSSNGLEWLLRGEVHKSAGILNGIDNQVWDPKTDHYLEYNLNDSVKEYKASNKLAICQRFGLNPAYPLMTFIGRLVGEKGADLLPELIGRVLGDGNPISFFVLGTGDPRLHNILPQMAHQFGDRFHAQIEYNEGLAHNLYAGSDFLLMPSRVEPCGLNQMYALRYGTIPIVRSIGGLKDTIPDIGEPDGSGRGIRFDQISVDDAYTATYRGLEVYRNTAYFSDLRAAVMEADFSWDSAARNYIYVYQELGLQLPVLQRMEEE